MTDSGKTVVSAALSVLAHVSFFAVLTLMPEAAAVPMKQEESPLEVTLEAAVQPQIPVTKVAVEADVVPVIPVVRDDAIQTQLDPEILKKADQAPEHPSAIAAHDSQAASPKPVATPAPVLPSPTPTPDSLELTIASASTPSPQPVEAVGIDALGDYGKGVGNAIGARWDHYRKTQKDLLVGEVRIKFTVDAQGRVSEIRVLSPEANPANIIFAERAVKESKIPPIPPERLAQVPSGCIEITYTFTIY